MMKIGFLLVTALIFASLIAGSTPCAAKAIRTVAQMSGGQACGSYFCKEVFEKDAISGYQDSVLLVSDSTGQLFCTYKAEVPEKYKDATGLAFPSDPNRYILTTWQNPGNPGGWTYRILDVSQSSASPQKICSFWSNELHRDGTFFGDFPGGVGLPQKADLDNKILGSGELVLSFLNNQGFDNPIQIKKKYTCSVNNDKVLECKDEKPIFIH